VDSVPPQEADIFEEWFSLDKSRASESHPSTDATPEPTTEPLHQPTEREKIIARIDNLLEVLHKSRDAKLLQYFALTIGVDFEKATDEQLERFISNLTDTIVVAQDKAQQRAARQTKTE
jgi:hypothetical protein